MRRSQLATLLVTMSCLAACHSDPPTSSGGVSSASAAAALPSPPPPANSAALPPSTVASPLPREGGALARSLRGDALYIADEDRSLIRRVALPLDESPATVTPMPGRPAQVLTVGDLLLITIRDPGLLLVMTPAADGTLAETARIALPADAWGLAVSPDGKTAVVTSAWTHQVSVIDLEAKAVRYSLDVEREPRGVVVRDGKVAYVSHLVGAALTRIDLEGAGKATRVDLPPAPLRTPIDAKIEASFGFSLAMSPDGKRLFAARHALGAPGEAAWFGAPTVDVLMLANDKPLAPARAGKPLGGTALEEPIGDTWLDTPLPTMVQPRAMVYRQSTKTLLVASEGANTLFELDAVAIDPGITPVSEQALGSTPDPTEPAPTRCGAPSGIALSPDEKLAYVWCRSTGDVALVELGTVSEARNVRVRHLADDALPAAAARGRRVFYDASDSITSGGLACSGCHPEGRDDGHVWMEVKGPMTSAPIFVGAAWVMGEDPKKPVEKLPRQTPMLAGRVAAAGPYGWHAQNDDLESRILEGVRLHRWLNPPLPWERLQTAARQRAAALADFLRNGLVAPPRPARPLTPQEERGREVFSSEETRCAGCHVAATDFTNRVAVSIKQPPPTTPATFSVEANDAFKTPSLLFVGGTAPYYHDGRAKTLEELIAGNEDRMGKTSQLSGEDRAALVAFLRTL